MVEDKTKKFTNRPKVRSKSKKRKAAGKNSKNINVSRKDAGDSKVSFAKDSLEIINVNYNDIDSLDSNNELKEIPTTGEELLKWTRERMSFSSTTRSDQESVVDIREEQEIPLSSTPRKSRSDRSEKSEKASLKRSKKKTHRKSKASSEEKSFDEDLYLNAPGPFEDEVMFQWRLKKEEQKNIVKKKIKSEVTFLEPSPNVERKSSSSLDMKKGRRKTRRSIQEAKKEAERQIEIELEEQRQREESYQKALLKHQQDEDEEILREQRNAITLKKIRRFEKERLDHIWHLFRKSEAEHYRTCEKVPLVTKSNHLTTFVKKWKSEIEGMDMKQLGETCCVNLELLNRLDELIFFTSPSDTEKMNQWKWASEILRNIQEEMLQRAMYNILSDIHKNLKIDNLDYGEFEYKNDSFTLSIWLKLDWPISLHNPKKQPVPNTQVRLSEVDLICIFPHFLKCDKKALICLYLPYNHFSDTCKSFYPPPKPDFFIKDICESTYEDKLVKQKYIYECYLRAEYKEKIEKYKEKHPDDKYPTPFVLQEIPSNEDIPKVPMQNLEPTPYEYADLADDLRYNICVKNMCREVAQDEVNLREYHLVGGLYKIELVYHPPQPEPLVRFYMTLRVDKPPKKLELVPFYSKFQPPPLPCLEDETADNISSSSKTSKTLRGKRLTARYGSKTDSRKGGGFDPEEVQKYKEAQENWEQSVQQEREKLIFISLGLPKDVIYLEKPIVCLWDEDLKIWTARDIYEVDHEHDGRRVTFRSSKFGLFGLSVRKFSNYPYKSWDIRPNVDDSISIVLEGSKVTISLIIQESEITIADFEYRLTQYLVGNKGLNGLIHKSMSLFKFIQTMNSSGLDMFPDYDANCYYTATIEKHWGMAYVTYYAMAQTSICYNFCNSKWNSETGRRSIVLRLREFDPHEDDSILHPFDVVQATPLRCQVLTCTEEDENFSTETTCSYKFQPNLGYLLKSMSTVTSRAKINDFSPVTIHTLASFLMHTRIFSFS